MIALVDTAIWVAAIGAVGALVAAGIAAWSAHAARKEAAATRKDVACVRERERAKREGG